MQPIYESQTFTLITSLLIAATIVAPLAAFLGGQLKEVLGEVSAFDGEGAAQVSAAFLLALLATLGYGADSVAPPVWVGVLCVGIAYSPVAWLTVRAVRGSTRAGCAPPAGSPLKRLVQPQAGLDRLKPNGVSDDDRIRDPRGLPARIVELMTG